VVWWGERRGEVRELDCGGNQGMISPILIRLMSFNFICLAPSLHTLARNDRESYFSKVSRIDINLVSGDVTLRRGASWDRGLVAWTGSDPSVYVRQFNIYDNAEAEWLYQVGSENIPAMQAIRNGMLANAFSGVATSLTFGVDSQLAPLSSAVQAILDSFYDPSATVNSPDGYSLFGDSDLPNSWAPAFQADNFNGGDGDDVLVGLLGRDVLMGGGGDDELYGGYDNDKLYGDAGNDVLYGEQNVDSLYGGDGDDFLDGGPGADYMSGGKGNDVYLVDNLKDVIDDNGASTDVDRVLIATYLSYVLPTNVEACELDGRTGSSVTGNANNNEILGNQGGNFLDGEGGKDTVEGDAGNDSLEGGWNTDLLEGGDGHDRLDGGTGADTLRGGLGNDTYFVENRHDIVDEATGEGRDLVESSVSFTMTDGLENLFLVGSTFTAGTGNDFANIITASDAGAKLWGRGGRDTLIGGARGDTLSGADDAGAGVGEVDQLTGGGGKDRFILGTAVDRYYDNQNAESAGLRDYALITDFTVGEDRLQLKGSAAKYYLGAQDVSGVSGVGVYFDSDGSGGPDADGNDELIAILQSASPASLTFESVIRPAKFV